ncbi:MAG TPA: hypothetical protein VGO43_10515 [Pyrinomonadaceae bacterium]|jgi:hypothetical protein|nr:hypothetical protein [Pyrinomonadaceae bacterium]
MIDLPRLAELISTYEGHGWILRRVVLIEPAAWSLSSVIGSTPIREGAVDAAWFSRPAKAGPNAWEIRYLGSAQFALVEHLEEGAPDFEEKIRVIEESLRDTVVAKGAS